MRSCSASWRITRSGWKRKTRLAGPPSGLICSGPTCAGGAHPSAGQLQGGPPPATAERKLQEATGRIGGPLSPTAAGNSGAPNCRGPLRGQSSRSDSANFKWSTEPRTSPLTTEQISAADLAMLSSRRHGLAPRAGGAVLRTPAAGVARFDTSSRRPREASRVLRPAAPRSTRGYDRTTTDVALSPEAAPLPYPQSSASTARRYPDRRYYFHLPAGLWRLRASAFPGRRALDDKASWLLNGLCGHFKKLNRPTPAHRENLSILLPVVLPPVAFGSVSSAARLGAEDTLHVLLIAGAAWLG